MLPFDSHLYDASTSEDRDIDSTGGIEQVLISISKPVDDDLLSLIGREFHVVGSAQVLNESEATRLASSSVSVDRIARTDILRGSRGQIDKVIALSLGYG